jgi:hypothetical protein
MTTENTNVTTTLEAVIDKAHVAGLCAAATLLRFASDVLMWDAEGRSTWVAIRAIDEAESNLRDAVEDGDDVNIVDARLSALRLRLGICGVRDVLQAGRMADHTIDDDTIEGAESRASRMLEAAAKKCYGLAWQADDAQR